MTELPPPEDAVDRIDSDDREETDELDDPWHDQLVEVSENFGSPEVLAILALVLAIASFFSFGLMNGTTYIAPYLANISEDDTKLLVTGIVLGALLAMVPVWLGWQAASRTLDSDPSWVATVARTAVVLGLASGLLRLVIGVLTAAHDGPTGFVRI